MRARFGVWLTGMRADTYLCCCQDARRPGSVRARISDRDLAIAKFCHPLLSAEDRWGHLWGSDWACGERASVSSSSKILPIPGRSARCFGPAATELAETRKNALSPRQRQELLRLAAIEVGAQPGSLLGRPKQVFFCHDSWQVASGQMPGMRAKLRPPLRRAWSRGSPDR